MMNYKRFDFQQYLNNIRLPYVQKKVTDDDTKRLLDAITEDMSIEDMDFYKDYLARFDVESVLDGYELLTNPNVTATKDDYLIFLRLIFASLSTNYEVSFDHGNKTVEVTLNLESGGRCAIRKLQELNMVQVMVIMESYLREQIKLEALRQCSDADDQEVIELQRDFLVYYFNTRVLKS